MKQIATWVKSNLGLCLWIPIVIPKGTLYGPNKDYNRDLIRITIGVQSHHADIWLHPSSNSLQMDFYPVFSWQGMMFLLRKKRAESPETAGKPSKSFPPTLCTGSPTFVPAPTSQAVRILSHRISRSIFIDHNSSWHIGCCCPRCRVTSVAHRSM